MTDTADSDKKVKINIFEGREGRIRPNSKRLKCSPQPKKYTRRRRYLYTRLTPVYIKRLEGRTNNVHQKMARFIYAATILVTFVLQCRASEQDVVVDIQYCLEHKLSTVECNIDSTMIHKVSQSFC